MKKERCEGKEGGGGGGGGEGRGGGIVWSESGQCKIGNLMTPRQETQIYTDLW